MSSSPPLAPDPAPRPALDPAVDPAVDPAFDPAFDPAAGPRVTPAEVRDLARLRRTVGPDRRVAGVAGGLARHLDVDPILLRVGLVVLVFFGGAGLIVYAACWLLVPQDGRDRAVVRLDDRNRTVALTVVGGLATLALLADSVGQWGFPWPLVVVATVALVVLVVVDRDRHRPQVTAPPVPHRVDPTTGQVWPTSAYAATVPDPDRAPPAGPSITGPPSPAPWTEPWTEPWTGPGTGPAAYAGQATGWSARPRRSGPILFWFTLALSALACATLGVADLAGLDVAPAAYPALVMGACGLLALVGSVWGRPGGLVPVGLVAAAVTAAAVVIGPWHGAGRLEPRPTTAADVRSDYRLTSGQVVLDLSRLTDPEALDGRTVHVDVRTGQILVIVPPGVDVHVDASASGAGQLRLFDRTLDGPDVDGSASRGTGGGAPRLTLDTHVLFGEIDVRSAS